MKSLPTLPRLHAITDERIARRPDLSILAQQLAAGGGGRAQLAFTRVVARFRVSSTMSSPFACPSVPPPRCS